MDRAAAYQPRGWGDGRSRSPRNPKHTCIGFLVFLRLVCALSKIN